MRQLAPIIALNLCAWLSIGRFTILWRMLIFSNLRMLCGRFSALAAPTDVSDGGVADGTRGRVRSPDSLGILSSSVTPNPFVYAATL
jgi:hypothetical protein